jgi:predicted PurR-regulated permease PerM
MTSAKDSSLHASPTSSAPEPGNTPRSFVEASLRAPVVGPIVFVACLAIIIIGLRYTAPIVAPLFLVITLAILFAPLLRWLERKGVPSGPAILVMIAGLLAFFAAFFWVVYVSLQQLVAKLPEYQVMLAQRLAPLNDLLVPPGVEVGRFVEGNFTAVSTQLQALLSFISGLASNIYYLFIYTFILFLLLAQSSKFAERFRKAKASDSVFVRQFARYTAQIQTQYTTQTFSNFVSAIAILAVLIVFGVDFAYLWAFLAFFLGYIPMIGLLIACVPAVFLAFIEYGLGTALVVLVLIILLNAAMDNFVTPRFMGDRLNLPMVFIMIGFIFWGWVYGPFGALLAVPLTLLVRVLLESSRATRLPAGLMTTVYDEEEDEGTPVANGVPATSSAAPVSPPGPDLTNVSTLSEPIGGADDFT